LFPLFLVAPIVYTSRPIVPVKIGQNVSLYCHIEAFPVPKKASIIRNDQLIEANEKYDIELKKKSFKSQLKLMIRNVQKQDLGSYTCFASNRLGNQQALMIIKGWLIVFPKVITVLQFEINVKRLSKPCLVQTESR
jgi:hypothetical protein